MKTDSSLIKASRAAAQRKNEETNGLCCSSSNGFDVGHSSSNAPGSPECHTASDYSEQEQESIEMSKWRAALELDFKPEPFNKDVDLNLCSTETAVYPEVLPAPLHVLDSTHCLFSEIQQSFSVLDPCLAPVITRLMELERLQAATVEKERAKLARSRPATSNTRNSNHLRKSDPPRCKTGLSRDAECDAVTCSFTKLMVSPDSSCRCRHRAFPSTKSGQGSRSKLPHSTLPKSLDSISGKCEKAETALPTFSVSVKVSQKATVPNRTKSPKTRRRSTSAKKATAPYSKT